MANERAIVINERTGAIYKARFNDIIVEYNFDYNDENTCLVVIPRMGGTVTIGSVRIFFDEPPIVERNSSGQWVVRVVEADLEEAKKSAVI